MKWLIFLTPLLLTGCMGDKEEILSDEIEPLSYVHKVNLPEAIDSHEIDIESQNLPCEETEGPLEECD